MTQYHSAYIKKSKLGLPNKKKFNALVAMMPDGDYLLSLVKMNDKSQRDWQLLYFAQIGEWSLSTGWHKDDLHELIKSELFSQLFDTETSTTELTNKQWNILMINLENFLILKFENK